MPQISPDDALFCHYDGRRRLACQTVHESTSSLVRRPKEDSGEKFGAGVRPSSEGERSTGHSRYPLSIDGQTEGDRILQEQSSMSSNEGRFRHPWVESVRVAWKSISRASE